jgi:DNA-binding CsgD family transcriptional regulator
MTDLDLRSRGESASPSLRSTAGQALTDTRIAAEIAPRQCSSAYAESAGVDGIIVPWNSPFALLIRSLGLALAAGNTVAVEMPGQTALVANLVSQIIAEVESSPSGVVNIFTESGSTGAPFLIASPNVQVISRMGSSPVGRIVAASGAPKSELDALEFIEGNAKEFASRGEGMGVTVTRWATAVLFNGLSRYHDAFAAAEAALEDPDDLGFWPLATVELIEAASRTGRADSARSALDRLEAATSASGHPWGAAIAARSRALLTEGNAAESRYRAAIELLTPTALRLDLARTRLVFGEWLRRVRRNVEAREQLRMAHGLFSDFGMEGFAERARVELRATGAHARTRSVETRNDLTPQEAQISRLVAEGATNNEIAAQLFITPSTVEYHLHKVFRKVGVKSRTQLARHVLESQSR